ncbi:hypothetical protein E2C01_061109 [Portunus trituberculatus]|uniref:Uncharacterized protein n=1 Tax=Portunus trituberculatus TaxID=210409 RepID=A0A5B7H4C4_PORTR|nr:hypothetical protein [Portunus trituberculatus]
MQPHRRFRHHRCRRRALSVTRASPHVGLATLASAATSTAPQESEKQKSGARRGSVRYVPRN